LNASSSASVEGSARIPINLGEQELGVGVPSLRAARELAGGVEEAADRRHGVAAEEGELRRDHAVERELEADVEVDDPLMVALGVEPPDLRE
jgi:hypothetical protein